jgi:hypothetical protein
MTVSLVPQEGQPVRKSNEDKDLYGSSLSKNKRIVRSG